MHLYGQLALAKSELGRLNNENKQLNEENKQLNEENKQLRSMLSRLTTSFNPIQKPSMQMQLLSLMQQQATRTHRGLRGAPGHEVNHARMHRVPVPPPLQRGKV